MRLRPILASFLSWGRVVVVLLLASCTGKKAPSPAATATSVPTPQQHAPFGEPEEDAPWMLSEEGQARADLIETARKIDRALCTDVVCCVTSVEEAGRDSKGQDLFVVGLGGSAACLAPATPPQPMPFGSGVLDHVRAPGRRAKTRADRQAAAARAPNEEEVTRPYNCSPADFHLVTRKGRQIRDVALLARSCNIPPDLPESGDTLGVDKEHKTVIYSGAGGASLWDDFSVTFGLDPLRIIESESSEFHRSSPNDVKSRSWNWDTFVGKSQWFAVDCKEKERKDAERSRRGTATTDDEDETDPTFTIEAAFIPLVDLPADFVERGWRTTGLGTCSASLDYSIFGEADPTGASGRVVMTGNTLFVEISDDRFVGAGKSWVKDDHLELWMGAAGDEDKRCGPDEDKGSMVQWGIRVSDGAVFPAQGSPAPLEGVERVVSKHKARFKIPLPSDAGSSITVVYSDSDDGKRQKHLIASSQLRFGDPVTLGETYAVDSADAICVVKNGALQPKRVPIVPASEAPLMEGRL